MKNLIQTGEIKIYFLGRKTDRKGVYKKDNDILLFSIEIKNKKFNFLYGGEIYYLPQQTIERILSLPHSTGMSGAKWFFPLRHQPLHITMNGYITFFIPFFLTEEEFFEIKKNFKEISPTEFLRGVSKETLLESFLEIIKSEKMSMEEITSIDWGAYSHMLPLFITFVRKMQWGFKFVMIKEIPYTFTSLLTTPFGEWYIPKGKLFWREFNDVLEIQVGSHRLYLYEKEGKIVLYHQHKRGVDGYEKYGDYIHPRCRISEEFFEGNFHILFKKRLGDIIFTDDERTLQPAIENNLQKLQVVNGNINITEDKTIITINPPGGIVYHPEHGKLVLNEGTWYIYQVPYEIRGHD